MIKEIFGYYGVDWLAMIGSLLSVYFLGNKKRYGFTIYALSNIAWIIVNLLAHIWAGVIVNVIVIFLNIRGYKNWGKPE